MQGNFLKSISDTVIHALSQCSLDFAVQSVHGAVNILTISVVSTSIQSVWSKVQGATQILDIPLEVETFQWKFDLF